MELVLLRASPPPPAVLDASTEFDLERFGAGASYDDEDDGDFARKNGASEFDLGRSTGGGGGGGGAAATSQEPLLPLRGVPSTLSC